MQSLIKVIIERAFFSDGFNIYVNILATLSLIATLVLLLFFNKGFFSSLFSYKPINMEHLVITMGVLLLSGMVHTEYTIAPIQFASYGILIVGLILQTVISKPSFHSWYSLLFLVLFSMAIPVMYKSGIKNHLLFHILEAISAIVLVSFFTYMTLLVFKGQGNNLLLWIPMIIAVVLDALLIAMRWNEEKNLFVLIFIGLSSFVFVLGKILFRFIK